MPKGLPVETCRVDAKRNCLPLANSKKLVSPASLVSIVGTKSSTSAPIEKSSLSISCKKKISTSLLKNKTKKTLKHDHDVRLKRSDVKNSPIICVKTRSGVGVAASTKDLSNERPPSEPCSVPLLQPSKMKDKAKVSLLSPKESVKSKSKDIATSKRATGTKTMAKKMKNELSKSCSTANIKNESLLSTNTVLLPKKDPKKRKEQLSATDLSSNTIDGRDHVRKTTAGKGLKKISEDVAVVPKKESLKPCLSNEVFVKRESRAIDEGCMTLKKRSKPKSSTDSIEAKKELDVSEKSLANTQMRQGLAVAQNVCPVFDSSLAKNVKFFKTKNKKGDKCKDTVSELLSSAISANDEALSVYDKLDEDIEDLTCKKSSKKKTPSKLKTEVTNKEVVTKSRRPLEELKTGKVIENDSCKVKKPTKRHEKRRLESESESEAGTKAKKMKRVSVLESNDDEANVSEQESPSRFVKTASKRPNKLNKKLAGTKRGEEVGVGSSSSDNAPLNRLVANKRNSPSKAVKASLLKRESLSDEIDEPSKSNKKKSKNKTICQQKRMPCQSPIVDDSKLKDGIITVAKEEVKASKTPSKKSVKFTKEARNKPVTAKPMPQRRQRMASLNAMAMVHCMYENESKNISVSSFDSTENSDDNGERLTSSSVVGASKNSSMSAATISSSKGNLSQPKKSVSFHAGSSGSYIQQSLANNNKSNQSTPAVLVKFEPNLDQTTDSVICRESLRMAPGLRSIGKHWDMNGSSISSTLSDDNEMLNMAAASTVSLPSTPVVAKEYKDTSFLGKPSSLLSKKKFSRASHRPVLDDSSEEEKHRTLLLEEKQRMMRRRRRQRSKEIAMDLKDMVVCKRMASLNATAILAASYSSSGSAASRRTVTVKSSSSSSSSAAAAAAAAATSSAEGCISSEKSNEKCLRKDMEKSLKKVKMTDNNLVSNVKSGRGKLPFIRKKFSSSSDADNEDEADVSGNEVVVKTASSSGKQQVSLIVNQDSGVTITGLYLNSTTKSTHRQGYCSISGMQYRISSTSHTQTEATTVTTEAVVRTPQEPLRPSMPTSVHADHRNVSPGLQNVHSANHPSPIKTYTPLGALSNMQPPGSPHHLHHHHHHHHPPKSVANASSTQEISSLERHGCPSAFSAPSVYGPPPPPPPTLTTVAARPSYPLLSKTSPEPSFVAGYYQPAGPLISHHHHHHHHHHHVQSNSAVTTSTSGLPTSTTTSASPSASTISFAKVSQSPLVQPPTPPASSVTQPVCSELSDSEMASATTPAAEITVSETATEETGFPLSYRFASSSSSSGVTAPAATIAPPFRSPSHNYQTYYPSPPSTASLTQQHTQTPQHQHQHQHQHQQSHFQEVLYSAANPSIGPLPPSSAGYHHGYLPVKGPHYAAPPPPPPLTLQRRYIPALPPQQQYFHHEYPTPVPLSTAVSQQPVIMPTHPLAAAAAAAAAAASDPYHSAPPTPSIIESYPPPLPPPPPLYYSGYSSAPPSPYYPYATSSRSLTLVETSCPCPLQGCQKNVDTGPLTGFISKGPVVEQRNTPLSPVALSLPKEPHDIRSLPSPARGSAGSRPTPSPAIATAKNPSAWSETCCDYGCDTAGLLTISKTNAGVGGCGGGAGGTSAAGDSTADLDSGIDGIGDLGDLVDHQVRAKRRSKRHEFKKMKLRRFRSAKEVGDEAIGVYCAADANEQCARKLGASLGDRVTGVEADGPMRLSADAGVAATAACLPRTRANCGASAFELGDSTDASYVSAGSGSGSGVEQMPPIKCQTNRKRWHRRGADDEGDPSDLDMPPKLYPEVDIDYQNRLRRSGAVAVAVDGDGQPPAKKSSNSNSLGSFSPLLDCLVNVEKSHYLSALELRSVSDMGLGGPELEPEPALATFSASALVQSLSPLNGYNDKRAAKTSAVEKTALSGGGGGAGVGGGGSGGAIDAKHSQTTERTAQSSAAAAAAAAAKVDRAPCGASKMALAVVECRASGVETRKPRFRRRRWTTKKRDRKKKPANGSKSNDEEKLEAENAERRRRAELLSLTQKRAACRLKWSNGWTWLGEPFVAKVFMNTESSEVLRTCYHAMKHQSGDIIRPKDCILLRSGSKKTDLPYVAKVAHLWEDPEDGEMMMSLFWYYRPEHTEHDAKSSESPYELYASKHKDVNSVACIEDKCYVLTFNEYCRYHKSIRQSEESVDISSVIVPPLGKKRYPRLALLPPENTSLDLVYFCRKIYDFRQHRLLKNPFFV